MKNYKFNKSMRLLTALFLFSSLFLSGELKSQDLTSNTFGKGLRITAKDSSFYMKFSARFQTLYQGELNLNTDDWSDQMLIRRSRLKFDGWAADPSLQYKIELGLSNRDHAAGNIDEAGNTARIILDAVVKWQASKNLSIWFGQTKLPGNRERVISSQNLQFVDRSLLNSRLNIDRDIGIQLHHNTTLPGDFIIRKVLSVSMGEGRNIVADNYGGYDFTYRVELLPFGAFSNKGDYFGSDLAREEKPKLALGVSYDVNQGASRQRGQLGNYVRDDNGVQYETDLKTLFIDAMFKYNGFSFMGEYGDKSSSDNVLANLNNGSSLKFVTGRAINLQSGYLLENNVEFAFRYTSLTPDDLVFSGMKDETQYTFGVSKYFVGHSLKLQSDISYLETAGGSDGMQFRFQVEVAF